MMRAGEQALKNGFAPALRFGGSQNCIYPWIGSIFYDHTDKLISKSDFTNKWFERCNLPNINSVLRGIYNNLINGGIGLVEVPNFDMILQKNLFSEFISDHLFYFTKDTLKTTLKINGFEVIDCSVVWYGYIISAVVKKIEKMKIENFYQQQDQIMGEINKYINCYKEKKVAIWGAGHQALAIISLANLSNKICYVIDSAVFKQNKYTPATHIPIVSPKNLVSEPPDAVIIIAASYSDEVAKNLMESFDTNLSISILRDNGLEIIRK